MGAIVIDTADGQAIDNDDLHWTVNCPECDHEFEYKGFFDSSDVTQCNCGRHFKTRRVNFDNGSYIQ